MKDIVFLVADGTMENFFDGLLPRIPTVSQTSEFTYDILVNPTHDAGNLNESHEFLRPFARQYKHAIVVFDHEGCGGDGKGIQELEASVQVLLDRNGWENRSSVLIIDPELENWVWTGSPRIKEIINWKYEEEIVDWVAAKDYTFNVVGKPIRPKEAFEAVLRRAGTPRSSSIYKKIASQVSYKKCTDTAFLKLIEQIKFWFPN